MAQDNIHKMYERLSTRFDLGTEEQFRDYVTASTDNSKKMYERMSTRFELGSEQEWLDFMGGAKQQRETAAAKGDAEGASTFSEAEIKAETAAAEPQQVNDLPIPPTQGKSTSGTPTPGAWPYAGAHRMQDGYVVSNAPGRDTGWRLNNEDGTPRTWAENVEAAKTDEQRAIEQFGDYRSGIVQDLLTDHAKTKAVPSERVVVDSEGNEVDRYEVTPELSQEEAEYQARDDYYKKVKLDGERWAELEAARKQVYDEYNKELGKAHKEISELYQYVDAGAPFDIYDKVSNRREVKALQGALKYYDDALTMVKEARAVNDSPNNFLGELAGLGRGLLDAGLDVSTWDMGMSDLDQGASTLSAILKLEAGKELTSAEQRLLAAAAANTYANSSLGEQMGMGYKAGQTTMMSVPFMIEMALNPASGLGSAGSKALSKHLIKKYGREMIQKQLKKRLARQAMAAKWTTKVGGDAASAIDMTLTSGAAMTAADAVDRMTGTIKPTEDEEGNIVYGGREDYEKSALTAGFKAVASGAIERQTEMVGGYIPAMKTAGVTFLGKAAKKATNPRLRKIYREAEELLDGKAFGKWGEMVGKVADVTKLNDLAGEFLEEKIGEVENAILVGDMKFDANSQTGIFNLDRNIETLVGLLPMQTFFGGMTLLGYRTQKYRTNQALNKANKAAWETFGEDWIEMKDMIDGCETDKDLTKVVRGIISGGTTDLRSQAAVMQYVSAVQRQKGLQLVAETAPEIVAQAEAEDAAAAAMPQTTENGGAVDAAAIPQPTENGGAVLQTAYDRGVAAAEADDYAAISDIGYQANLADARIERMFDEAQRAEIAEAENTEGGLETWLGNNRESLSAEQAFAVQALIDANDAYDGLTETVRHRSASEEDAIRQEMQPLATADGRIVPLTLDNGQTVYLKSGDPTNRRSTVIAAYRDETGAVKNTQVSGMSITSIGTEQSLSDYALEAMGNINNERQQRIKDAMDGKNVAAGQTVRLYAGDELQEYEATAVAPEGVTLRSKIDGSEMTMTTEELQDELAMSRQKRIENDLAAAAMPQPTTENAGAAVAAAAQPQPTENADAKEEERRKPLRTRVAQWSKDIGADIEIHEDTNSITSSAVLNQINSGQGRVRGWYDNATGKVHVYMPGITDEHDIDETVIHEIVAHKGLRQLMGSRFDALCDKVYEMMSEDARQKYLAYPGVNGDTRAAADEYMAYLAENIENLTAEEQNVWQAIVAAVREFIKSVMSGSKMTDAQIEQLIRASYLNMKAQREQATEAAAEPQLTENTRAAAAEREQEPAATDQQLAEKENLESQENAEKNVSLQTKEGRMGVVARQKNSAARLAKAKEIYGSDPTTAPFFDDMDVPQTAEELVAMTLVPRSINWEGIDRGTQHIRGLQEEMGRNKKRGIGRNFDTYGFNPYLAKKGEGVGIEKLVEDIWRSDKNGMGEGNMLGDQRRFDEHEIKDALLSLLSGAQTSKDISDYVLNNRIAQAEAAIEYMEEEAAYEQELYEQERREDARLAGILELTEEDWLQMEAEYADKIAEIEAKEREQKEIFQQILEQDHQQVEYYGRANQEEVASERGIRMAEESAERGTVGSAERGETVLRGTQDTREAGLSVGDAELSEGALGAQDGRDGRSEDVHTQEAERSAVGETEALPQFTEELERQKAETNTSPTEAQKEAGNYKKGHLTFGGYKFTIENPKGSVRSGKDKKGKAWKVTMPVTYGYILGKKGKDGDHLDMFINDKADLSTWNGSVFVVDQVNPETGEFDEHKIMYGFNDITDAIRAYLMSYTRPWQGMGNITEVSKEIFDEWVASSDRKLKPFAETRFGDKADVGTKVIRAAEERAGKRQEGETPEQDRDKQIEKAYKRGYNSYRQEQYTDETLLEMYASMSNEAIEADISKMERSIEEEKAYKDSEEYQERRSNESSDYTRAQTEGVAARAGKSVKALETKIAEAKKVLELRSMAEGSADEGVRFSAVDDGTAAMPQYTEEEQGIVDEAKKNGTWMKAPNGKATNLTEKQWAQVRTKAFKKWFGDWEKAALSNAILLQPSLPIQKHSYNKEDLKAIYNRLQPVHKGAYVIKFFTSAFNKNYRAGGLFAKIVPQLSDILEVSLLAYSEGDNLKGTVRPDGTTHKEHRNVESFDNYVTKVNIEGKDYFVRITVQKEHNGTTGTHSFFVTNVSVYNNSISGASDSTSGGARLTVDAITDAKLQKFFKDSKASYVNSSKIVDENGEPMVVYHGSMHHNFTVFKNNGSGIYFTPDKDAADYGLDANPYAVFINMREPLNLDFEGDVDNEATENHDSLENEYKNAIAEGYDGVVAENTFDGENEMTQIVVHRSNQIKSATDNVGTFDEGNDDIRFSVEDIQEEYDIPSELFDYYKKSIELGNLTAATQALNGIKDVVRQNIGKKLSEFISVYKGIRDVIFDELGDIEKLREERERAALEQYDLMEAARKRAEEEAAIEAEKSRQLEMIVDLDSEYDKALQENDMERAQDLVSEAARRKGYIVTDYKDAHSAPVAQIERKEFTNLDALRDLSDNGFDLNVFALANGISNQPLEIFDRGMERAYMNVDAAGRESLAAIRSAISAIKDQLSEHGEVKDIPKIKVYRAAPKSIKGGLESGGQWVSPSLTYTQAHGEHRHGEGKYRIIEEEVPADELWWDGNDVREWGFDDGRNYVYKNTKNNKKLFDTVTYDDAGKIIPLSKRFNSKKSDVRFRTKKSFEAGSRYEVKERVYNYYESEELDYYESEELVTGAYQTPHQLLEAVRNKHEGYAWKMNDDATEIECLGRWNELLPKTKKNGRNDGNGNNERIAKKTERAKTMIGDVAKMLGLDVEVIENTEGLADKKKSAKGWYDVANGKIVVVLPNHTSNADVMATLLHEGVAHHGLRRMFGEDFDTMLDNVYEEAWAQDEIDALAGENASKEQIREATEEYLARLAEDMNFEKATEQKWWDYIRKAFVSMLRKAGITIDVLLTNNELRYLLWRSYQNLKETSEQRTALETMEDHKKQKKLGVYDGTGRIDPAVAVAEDIRFSFIGEQGAASLDKAEEAATRLDNLSVAREMEEAGKDAKSIKMATGWERGADGKWRYEVDDKMEGIASPMDKLETLHKEYKAAEKSFDRLMETSNRLPRLPRTATEEQKAKRKEFDNRLKEARKTWLAKREAFMEADNRRSYTLEEILGSEHELFAAYPRLKTSEVSFMDKSDYAGYSGAYMPESGNFWISPTADNPMSVLTHEIQHAIQHIEGFAQGGNTRSVQTKAETLKKDVQPLYEMIHDTPEWAEYKMLVNDYFDEYGKDQLDNDKIAEIENRLNEIEDSGVLKEIENKRKELKRKYGADATVTKILNGPFSSFDEIWEQLPSGFYDKFDAYYRLGGEVEARNAAERMGMTAEERRASLASETEDVAREDQVFIFEGMESAAIGNDEKVSFSVRDWRKEIQDAAEANGTWLKAPNGNKSNLNRYDWVTARGEKFKKWFGDWENGNANNPDELDANGEPLKESIDKYKTIKPIFKEGFKKWFGDWENGEVKRPDLLDSNGMPSEEAISRYVRFESFLSDEFKQWFGDWENGETNFPGLTDSDGNPKEIALTHYYKHKTIHSKSFKEWLGDWENGSARFAMVLGEDGLPYDWVVTAYKTRPKYPTKPEKEIGESQAVYFSRYRLWERAKDGYQSVANKYHDDVLNGRLEQAQSEESFIEKAQAQYEIDLAKWKEEQGIPDDATPEEEQPMPLQGERSLDYANRLTQWQRRQAAWKLAPKLENYIQAAKDDYLVYLAKYEVSKYPHSRASNIKLESAQLAKLRHAVARQKNYDKNTVQAVVDFAQQFLMQGFGDNISRGDIRHLLSAVRNATGVKDIKQNIDKIIDILVDNHIRNIENAIQKMASIKAHKMNAQNVSVQGKLELRGQRLIKAYNEARATNMTIEELENMLSSLTEKMVYADPDTAAMYSAEYDGYSLALMYAKDITGSLKEYTLMRKELRDAESNKELTYREKAQLVEQLRASMLDNRVERIHRYSNFIDEFSRYLDESIEGAKDFNEAQKRHQAEIYNMAMSDLAGVSSGTDLVVDRKSESLITRLSNNPLTQFFSSPLATFEQILKLFGQKYADGRGRLYNYFMQKWAEATRNEWSGKQKQFEILDDKAREIFGGKVKRWADLYSIVGKMPGIEISYLDVDGVRKTTKLTQGNLLYIYMANKMADGAIKLRKQGISESDMAVIEEKLDPRLKSLADWVQSDFFVESRKKYNKIHIRLFGAPMAEIENYVPIRILSDARYQELDVARLNKYTLPSTVTGAIVNRRINSLPLDIAGTDALSLVVEHVEEMEHWAAFAEFSKDISTLLSYTPFRNKVKNMQTIYGSGDALWDRVMEVSNLAAGTYRPVVKRNTIDNAIANISKGLTLAKVAFRINTALKQLVSAIGFLHDIDIYNLFQNPFKAWKWAIKSMPQFQERWLGRKAGDTRLEDSDLDWKQWRQKFIRMSAYYGMTPNAFVDAVVSSCGAYAVYKTKYKRYKKTGYDNEQAHQKALLDAEQSFNLTQQSSKGAYIATIQADRTVAASALSVFRNSSFSFTRQSVEAFRNLRRKIGRGYKEEAISHMKRQMMLDGIPEDKAEAAAKSEYSRSIRRDLIRIVVFSYMNTIAWQLAGYWSYLLFGDDDEEKEKALTDALIRGMLAGPIEGLAGGNILSDLIGISVSSEGLTTEGLKNYRFYGLPAFSDIQKMIETFEHDQIAGLQDVINLLVQIGVGTNPEILTNSAIALIDYCNGDLDSAFELGLLLLRLNQSSSKELDSYYIDALGMSSDEIKKADFDELAKRWATYKMRQNAPMTSWMYSDERESKKMESYMKAFDKKVQERMEGLTEEQFEKNYNRSESNAERLVAIKIGGESEGLKHASEMKNAHLASYLKKSTWDDIREDMEIEKKKRELAPVNKRFEELKDSGASPEALNLFVQENIKKLNLYKTIVKTLKDIRSDQKKMQNPGEQGPDELLNGIRQKRKELIEKFK